MVASKAGAYVTSATQGNTFTDSMTGSDVNAQTYTLTNVYASLDKGSIGTIGWVWLRSLSANPSDVCSVSTDGGVTEAGICKAGLPYGPVFRNSSTSLKVKFTAGSAHDIYFEMAEA